MASVIGLLVFFLATLTLGGCAGTPYDYGYGAGAGMSGYGCGGSCPQPYAAPMPVPMPMAPGYAVAPPAVIYAPQPQPYFAPRQPYSYNGATDHRERDQAARIRAGRRDGSLTPNEARRLGAEQRHIRGAEARMSADGNLSPHEQARLNTRQNHASQDIYRARHNDVVQPGAAPRTRRTEPTSGQ